MGDAFVSELGTLYDQGKPHCPPSPEKFMATRRLVDDLTVMAEVVAALQTMEPRTRRHIGRFITARRNGERATLCIDSDGRTSLTLPPVDQPDH